MIWRRKNEKENRTCLLDFIYRFSGIGFFINFMSTPPVNDTHTFTLYMIGAAVVSLLYPGIYVCSWIEKPATCMIS